MISKKGVSAIVATALLIVITLALAAIIATVAIPFVRNSLQGSTECSAYKNHFTFDSSFNLNCHDYSGTIAKISIKAGQVSPENAAKIKGVQFVFMKTGGSSESISFNEGSPGSCSSGGIMNYDISCPGFGSLTIPEAGESRSYKYYPKSKVEGYVSVNPILASGKTCDTSDRIKMTVCSS